MDDVGVAEVLLGFLVGAIGWWVSTLTGRVVSMTERVSHLEGVIEERNRQEELRPPP